MGCLAGSRLTAAVPGFCSQVRKQALGKLPSVVILLVLIVMVLASLVYR